MKDYDLLLLLFPEKKVNLIFGMAHADLVFFAQIGRILKEQFSKVLAIFLELAISFYHKL